MPSGGRFGGGALGRQQSQASAAVAVQRMGATAVSSAARLNVLGQAAVLGAGDTAHIVVGSQPSWSTEPRLVTEGDSLTDYENSGGQNWQWYFTLYSGARFYRPQGSNQGVGGQKISGLLGDSTYMSDATQIAAVRAQLPDVVTLMAGTNDIAGGVTNVTGLFDAFKTAIAGYLASDGSFAGARYVVVGKVPPRNPLADATWTAAKERVRGQLNALIATLPSWDPRVIIAETDTDNDAGSWDLATTNATFQPDGIHQSWLGFRIIGFAFARAIARIQPAQAPTWGYLNPDNLLTNAQLWGTGGSKVGNAGATPSIPVPTGEVADSWTVANNAAGVDVACSKSSLNGAIAQRMVFSGTLNSGTFNTAFLRQTVTYSGTAGEGYELVFDVEIASGFANVRNIYAYCDTATIPVAASTTPFVSDQRLSGSMRTKITLPLAAADSSNDVRVVVTFNTNAQPVSLDMKIARPYLRKSNQVAPL